MHPSAAPVWRAWDWEPSVVLGCALAVLLYLIIRRFHFDRRTVWFLTGIGAILFALVSPLDDIGDNYLYSAHMLQHLILLTFAPPLLVIGLPGRPMRWLAGRRFLRPVVKALSRPWIAWPLAMATLWIWHVPTFYGATLGDEQLHIVEHITFIATGVIFWWPALSPLAEYRLSPPIAVFYLASTGMMNTMLGIVIAFSRLGHVPAYWSDNDPMGLLPLFRWYWNVSPGLDQQIAGLLMWIPGSLVYLTVAMIRVVQWLRIEEESEPGGQDAPPAQPRRAAPAG